MTDKAVILARGLGKRMRQENEAVALTREQQAAAATGVKALLSVGRPFVDHLLSALVAASIRRVCLVVGPEQDALRNHCQSLPLERLQIDFAIQEQPLGTADAVRAAREFAGDDSFLVINSDNYYPSDGMNALVNLSGQGLLGFSAAGLQRGNIERERIRSFAVVKVDANGFLTRIVEKPTPDELAKVGEDAPVSMNCWKFSPGIFTACDNITPTIRGELELVSAVQYGIDHLGLRWKVVPWEAPVWDLTSRQDIAAVTDAIGSLEVRL